MVVTDHNHHHHPTWPYIYIYIDKVKTNWKLYYIYSWDQQGTCANIYKCGKNSKVGLKWYKWKIIPLQSCFCHWSGAFLWKGTAAFVSTCMESLILRLWGFSQIHTIAPMNYSLYLYIMCRTNSIKKDLRFKYAI